MCYNDCMSKARIVSNPKILGGKPVIAGTRISVELIMNFLSAGMGVDDILKEYPELKREEILSAIDFAGELVSQTKITDKSNKVNFYPASFHETFGR